MPFHLVLLDPLTGNAIKSVLLCFNPDVPPCLTPVLKKLGLLLCIRNICLHPFFVFCLLQEIAAYLITFEKHDEWLTTSPKTR